MLDIYKGHILKLFFKYMIKDQYVALVKLVPNMLA